MSEQPENPGGFRGLVAEAGGITLPMDDLLHLVLPLLRQVHQLHTHGRVAKLDPRDVQVGAGRRLQLLAPDGQLRRKK